MYILPNCSRVSALASYLARRDILYQRLIFVPATSLPIFPMANDKHLPEFQNRVKRNMDVFGNYFAGDPKRVMPFELLEANLMTYITEAEHFIKLYVYQVQIMHRDFSTDTKTIFFHDYIELGVNIEKEVMSMSATKAASLQSSFELEMEIELMDNNEKIASSALLDTRSVSSLIISNIETKPGWHGPDPCPQMKYLDMCFIDKENYAVVNKNADLYKKGVRVPFEALHRNHRMHSCTLHSSQPIHLKIDDNYYGPLTMLQVKPLELIKSKHFFLPIMTFSHPVDL